VDRLQFYIGNDIFRKLLFQITNLIEANTFAFTEFVILLGLKVLLCLKRDPLMSTTFM